MIGLVTVLCGEQFGLSEQHIATFLLEMVGPEALIPASGEFAATHPSFSCWDLSAEVSAYPFSSLL